MRSPRSLLMTHSLACAITQAMFMPPRPEHGEDGKENTEMVNHPVDDPPKMLEKVVEHYGTYATDDYDYVVETQEERARPNQPWYAQFEKKPKKNRLHRQHGHQRRGR